MPSLPDGAARERAATAADRNIVVTAGAGTGKTTLLVDRLVHLLMRQSNPLGIGEIVALTFTNKAANEMKLRLRERLSILLTLDPSLPPTLPARRRDWEQLVELQSRYGLHKDDINARAARALRELEKSQLGTIHSFAAHLLRLYPVEAGVDPAFQEDDGSQWREHFEREWALWLDEELGPAGTHHDLWRVALRTASLEELQQLAEELAGELIPLDGTALPDGEGAALPQIREWLAGMVRQAQALRAIYPRANTLERMLDAAVSLFTSILDHSPGRDMPNQQDGPGTGHLRTILDRSIPQKTTAWTEADYQQARHMIRVAQAMMRAEDGSLAPLLRLLVPFAATCRRRFVQDRWISFDGLLARARALLRDHPRVRRELKRQFRAVLVDEFQDTDPVQYELVLYLAEAPGREETDWRAIRLEPGKLFIVGDPKQSIYAFRRADIEAYDVVVDDHILAQSPPGERLSLLTNFRSHAGLLTPINSLFSTLFPPESVKGLQPRHEPLLPHDDARPLPQEGIELRLVKPARPEADTEAATRAEAEELARWLSEEVLGREEIQEKGARVTIKPSHVAILFRTLTNVREYLDALRRYQVPVLTEGEKHFYECQEVIDLINLLRAAANPHDRLALVGVLRSSLGGLPDAEIERLARAHLLDYRLDPGARLGATSHSFRSGEGAPGVDAAEHVQAVYELLRELHRELPRLPLTEVVDAVLARAPLLELAAASLDGEQAVANLLKLRDLAAELARRPHLTLQGLLAILTSRAEESAEETERSLAEESEEESEGAVRLLSIHKAKGLEFPVVILAGLHRGTDRREPRIAVHHDWSTGIVGIRLGDLQSLGGVYLRAKLAQRQQAEQERLLYVAMTRAKRRLILSAALPGTGRAGGESFLSLLGRGFGVDFAAFDERATALGQGALAVKVIEGREPELPARHRRAVWQEVGQDLTDLQARWEEREQRRQALSEFLPFTSPSHLAALEEEAWMAPTEYQPAPRPWIYDIESGSLRERARLVGTLAHRLLQDWDFGLDPAELLRWAAAVCRRRLPRLGVTDFEPIIGEIETIFRSFLASAAYAELRSATILGREVPFIVPQEGDRRAVGPSPLASCHLPDVSVMEGVVDVLYRLGDHVWVADYKTDRVETTSERAERVAAYTLQARIYKEAVAQCLGEPVRFKLIFLRTGDAVEL